MTNQKTILNSVDFSGIGVHTGEIVNVKLLPAKANAGILFKRVDKTDNNEIQALYSNVVQTHFGTVISNADKISVSTIEHLMSSLWAYDIDNVIVEIDGGEVPIMDGSAKPLIDIVKQAGAKDLGVKRKMLKILKPVKVSEGDATISIEPYDGYEIDMEVNYPYGGIGKQTCKFTGQSEEFINQISKARTFCYEKEIDQLKSMGMAKGGSLDNAIVYTDTGMLNEGGLRYPTEAVRHKTLDCVGDMFTAGYFIQGKIKAYKTGHGLNNKLLRAVFADKENYQIL